MVHAIISWSLHNRFIVILGVIAMVGFGIHAASNLNVEAYPDPTPPLVEVITQNPGASPEEMERLVGIPLETTLNGMPGLEDLRSTSIAGLNDIKCQFAYGTDYWAARQEVINRIGMVNTLPQGVQPGLSPWSPTGEIVRYVLEGPGYTTNQIKAVQDWVLTRALKTVPGVIDVTGYGGTVKQYQVLLDPRLLRQYELTLQQVEDAISSSNANIGGDILTLGNFGMKGTSPVGTSASMGRYGTYDMAGNVKEWCWNDTIGGRMILGGGWNEPSYMYDDRDAQQPFSRLPAYGVRLVRSA